MDIRQGIISTAQSVGIDPLDLATAISYETAGTFDPTKAGPTTKWGQHRGLIQFGEPQAQQYGVDWNNPIGSQLGENGAVAKYLRDTGVKEGMGLLDVYSAINAGGVGRYNRSDTAAGGAAGTVADKVRDQMADHRANAEQLLGSYHVSSKNGPAERVSKVADKSSGLLGNLIGDDRRDRLIMALEGMTLNPNQALIQSAGQGIQQRREQAASSKQKNATADWLEGKGRADLADGVRTGAIPAGAALQQAMAQPSDDRTALQKNYEFFISQGLAPEQAMAAVKAGTTVNVNGDSGPKVGTIPQGYELFQDPSTSAYQMRPIAGGPAALELERQAEAAEREAAAEAERLAKADAATGQKEATISSSVDYLIEKIEGGRFLDVPEAGVIGNALGFLGVNQEAVDFKNELSTVQANIAFDRLQQMREASKTGGALGAVSERELDLLMNAYGNLNQSTSPERLKENLKTIKEIMTKIENDPIASGVYYGGSQSSQVGAGAGDGFSITGVIE